jgi:hypothetical protein
MEQTQNKLSLSPVGRLMFPKETRREMENYKTNLRPLNSRESERRKE